ncbi:cell division protein FtsL [Thiohalocapsa marina]|uniref:cell division protein FtsL n=1 Tax=Thiohalocapsa marina TaxID=424902 RepID=UPI00319E301B
MSSPGNRRMPRRRLRGAGASLTRARVLGLLTLGLAVIGSAMAVVHVKYLTRGEFGVLQQVRAERDALDVEWGRLQIEEAALTSHTRIEDNARTKLDMYLPGSGEVRVVEVRASGSEQGWGQSDVR